MAFPTITAATDDFSVSQDPLSLARGWAQNRFNAVSGSRLLQSNGTAAFAEQATAFCSQMRDAVVGPDTEVGVQVATKSANATELVGLFARAVQDGATTVDCYALFVSVDAGADVWQIDRIVNNGNVTLGATVGQEVAAGDHVGFEVTGTGATVTLTGYLCPSGSDPSVPANWTQIIQRTDTSGSRLVAAGRTGIECNTNVARFDRWFDGSVVTGGGPQTIAVAQAVETETASTLGRLKALSVGQVTDTETAQTIVARKARAVAQATETETAQTITVSGEQVITVAQALETETGQAVTPRKARAVTQAVETESAQTVTARKQRAAGQATETETAQAATPRKSRTVAQAVETETAQQVSIPGDQTIPVDQATETEAAQAVTGRKTVPVTQAVETETARAVTRVRVVQVTQATETETAGSVTSSKRGTVGQAVETETAFAVIVLGGDTVALKLRITGNDQPAVSIVGVDYPAERATGTERPAVDIRGKELV
jgi:hypothetical protein